MGAETYGSLLQAHTLPTSTCPLPRGGPSGRVHGLLGTLASVVFGSRQEEGNITLLFTLIQATGDTRATGTRQLCLLHGVGLTQFRWSPLRKQYNIIKRKHLCHSKPPSMCQRGT